jgi:hypothetical protein
MSLLSSILLPEIEKQLIALEPQIAQFVMTNLHELASEFVTFIESKIKFSHQIKEELPTDVPQ